MSTLKDLLSLRQPLTAVSLNLFFHLSNEVGNLPKLIPLLPRTPNQFTHETPLSPNTKTKARAGPRDRRAVGQASTGQEGRGGAGAGDPQPSQTPEARRAIKANHCVLAGRLPMIGGHAARGPWPLRVAPATAPTWSAG